MESQYIFKLSFQLYSINFKAQKIDNFIIEIFEIVLTSFKIENKLEEASFFLKTFLFADYLFIIIEKIVFYNKQSKQCKYIT